MRYTEEIQWQRRRQLLRRLSTPQPNYPVPQTTPEHLHETITPLKVPLNIRQRYRGSLLDYYVHQSLNSLKLILIKLVKPVKCDSFGLAVRTWLIGIVPDPKIADHKILKSGHFFCGLLINWKLNPTTSNMCCVTY